MDNVKILIECIKNDTRIALNNIKELEKVSVDLISKKSTNKENYERIHFITNGNNNYY